MSSRSPLGTRFTWTKGRELAALLTAEGELTDAAIADRAGVSPSTLKRWREAPEFDGRVKAHLAAMRSAALNHAVARKERRIAELQETHERIKTVIEERAIEMADVPGGKSGLLTRSVKIAQAGKQATVLTEYAFDSGLVREFLHVLEQAAREVGEWGTAIHVSGPEGGPIQIEQAESVTDRLLAWISESEPAEREPLALPSAIDGY